MKIRVVITWLGCVWLAAASTSAETSSLVQILQEPASIERRTFPAGHPPPVIRFPKEEAAVCSTQFGCACEIEGKVMGLALLSKRAQVIKVRVTTNVKIVVWTPDKGPRSYLDHEETHRAISEHYYRSAHDIADGLARQVLNRRIPLAGKDKSAELDAALKALSDRLMAEFIVEVSDRCSYAQDRFDAISDHGRAAIAPGDAMQRALDEEAAHWETSAPAAQL